VNFWPFKPRIGPEAKSVIDSLGRDAVRFHVPSGFGEPHIYTDIGAMVTEVALTTGRIMTSPNFPFTPSEERAVHAAYRNAVMREQLKIAKG
jgi:hypothetical protein